MLNPQPELSPILGRESLIHDHWKDSPADLLGEDFICYKTDCIYYRDTAENRELVQSYLDSVGLEWKQLVEPARPKKEESGEANF